LTEALADVWKAPLSGLPNNFSSHWVGRTGFTFDQSASSSSATMSGSVVKEPCPISAAGDTIEIVPSVAIDIQTLAGRAASAAAAPLIMASPTSARGSAATVSANVRPAAVSLRNERRSIWFMDQPSRDAR